MKDIAKAKQLMGRDPINPIGECFESAAALIVYGPDMPDSARLCHGIGVANLPGEEGLSIGHAWIEATDTGLSGERIAYDTTWGVATTAEHYRQLLQLQYAVEYTRNETITLWKERDFPGPWDPRIKAVTPD